MSDSCFLEVKGLSRGKGTSQHDHLRNHRVSRWEILGGGRHISDWILSTKKEQHKQTSSCSWSTKNLQNCARLGTWERTEPKCDQMQEANSHFFTNLVCQIWHCTNRSLCAVYSHCLLRCTSKLEHIHDTTSSISPAKDARMLDFSLLNALSHYWQIHVCWSFRNSPAR